MEIKQQLEDDVLTLSVIGELDASSSIVLDNALKKAFEEEHYKVMIDCSGLNYISSAGLGVFISYIEDFNKKDGKFVFYGMHDNVYEVFKILGLHQVFRISVSQQEANQLMHEG